MDIFTALATTCIKVGANIFKKPLQRRLAPERRKARYLLRLYESLRDCHDSYIEWKSTVERLQSFTGIEWESDMERRRKAIAYLAAEVDIDFKQDDEEDGGDIGEENNRDFGVIVFQEYTKRHPEITLEEAKTLSRFVEEERVARLAWGHSINHLHETMTEGRSFLEIHNEKLADVLFAYSENEDDGFEEAELDLDTSDLRKRVPTADFERARSMLVAFVRKHTTHEDFF
jgi:hypothetical protein